MKDRFVLLLESRTEDGEMTGAKLVTKGAFIRGAMGVTMTDDFAVSASVVFTGRVNACGGGWGDIWEGWWVVVEG